MDSDERVCPVCGQPVETVIWRHKTLGAWVPTWVAGPCRNRACAAYVAPAGAREPEEEQPGAEKDVTADEHAPGPTA
ncbi:hypothetical protein AB0D49_14380 [Streptomyces sp. NPDC048290]|uniref:hypothetical protein n=1 Tax=Streptomyces sp. NPDC048290 TaxID=3155811 RepID=UPI003440852A